MKRSAIARGTKGIAPRSKRTIIKYAGPDGRAAFVARMLKFSPQCEVQGPNCWGRADQVHESITRSKGGEILPGPKADAQSQTFHTVCGPDHSYIHEHREFAESKGWLQ